MPYSAAVGRHRDTKDVPARALRDRGRRGRGDRRRAPPARYQGLNDNHARDTRGRAARLAARAAVTAMRHPGVPHRGCRGQDAAEPPDLVPPPGRAEPAAGPERPGGNYKLRDDDE